MVCMLARPNFKYGRYGDSCLSMSNQYSSFHDVLLSITYLGEEEAYFFRARLVWQENDDKKKYHLVDWKTYCLPKEQGGLEILNPEIINKVVLAKWSWKLETETGIWTEILLNKYVKNRCLSSTD